MRVPAAYAGELSAIDREKWLKRSRKMPGPANLAQQEHYLKLPAEALPEGIEGLGGEVKFFPKEEGSGQGMVALNWISAPASPDGGGRLWLLKTEGGRYVPQPLMRRLPTGRGPRHYSLTVNMGAITEYQRATRSRGPTWRKTGILLWSGGQWVRE